MTSTREERLRQGPLISGCFGLGMGIFSLYTGFNRPTIANMRTIDLIHLLGTGACLGAGLAGVMIYFFGSRKG